MKSPAATRQLSILWIDDEVDLIKPLVTRLRQNGVHVEIAADGRAGLAQARLRRHDILILDFQMPGMSGMDVLRALREDSIQTPVIMLTGHGTEEVAFEVGSDRLTSYYCKPIRASHLVQALHFASARRSIEFPKDSNGRLQFVRPSTAVEGRISDSRKVVQGALADCGLPGNAAVSSRSLRFIHIRLSTHEYEWLSAIRAMTGSTLQTAFRHLVRQAMRNSGAAGVSSLIAGGSLPSIAAAELSGDEIMHELHFRPTQAEHTFLLQLAREWEASLSRSCRYLIRATIFEARRKERI